jgi:hypothetical protein
MSAADVFEVHNYRGHRVELSYDDPPQLDDLAEYWGRLGWVERDWAGRTIRPEWADGAARIVRFDRGSGVWWRPADDLIRAAAADLDSFAADLARMLAEGFAVMTVSRLDHDRVDATGRPWVVAVESLGGLDPWAVEAWRETADELLESIDAAQGTRWPPEYRPAAA